MALNWSDTLRAAEKRATASTLRQMPFQQRLQRAMAQSGNVLNTTSSNLNPESGSGLVLRCDTVRISDGVLK